VEKVTSSCLHLSWSPPLFNGGLDVVNYLINYTIVRREKTVTKGLRVVSRPCMIETGSNATR